MASTVYTANEALNLRCHKRLLNDHLKKIIVIYEKIIIYPLIMNSKFKGSKFAEKNPMKKKLYSCLIYWNHT